MELLGYFSLFFVGLTLGTFGSGGSILAVPILVYLFSFDAVMASAYSLFIVGIASMAGAMVRIKTQMVSKRAALAFGIPSLIAVFATRKWILRGIPDILVLGDSVNITKRSLLLCTFGLLMIVAALVMIVNVTRVRPAEGKTPHMVLSLILPGMACGFLSGLTGVGGGFLIIPLLFYFTAMPFKKAVGTALFIISANSVAGFTGDTISHSINWSFLLVISCLAVAGIVAGSRITAGVPNRRLQKPFGWVILVLGICMIIKEIVWSPHDFL